MVTINLEFTKDPSWIVRREQLWEKIKDSYSSELTRTQVKSHHQYFLTGVPPQNLEDLHQFSYVTLFPLQTEEGLRFCFKEYFNPDDVGLGDNWCKYFSKLYAKNRCDVEYEEAIKLFGLFFGDYYCSRIKFPFLLANESQYRQYSIDPKETLYHFTGPIISWIKCPGAIRPLQADLIDYMFSIFPYIPADKLYFVIPLTPSPKLPDQERRDVDDTIQWCKRIHEFLCIVNTKGVAATNDAEREEKIIYLQKIFSYLDELTSPQYPQTLIDHWRWVKEGKKLRFTPV